MSKKFLKKMLIYVGLLCVGIFLFGQITYGAEKSQFAGTTVVLQGSSGYMKGFKLFEKEIAKEYGIKIKYDMTPCPDAYNKSMLEFAVGRSTWDMVLFMPCHLADYQRHLEPLEPLADKLGINFYLDDIMPTYRDIYCSWKGILYAIPFDADQHNLYYNKEAFAKYGFTPPQTWDEFDKIAEFFNGKDWDGDGQKEWGVVEAWKRGGYAFWWWMNRFAAYGGVYFDEEMNPLVNSPGAKKAMEHMMDIIPFVPPGTANFAYAGSENAFIKSDVPMIVNWSSVGKSLMDPTRSDIVGKGGVALIPGAVINGKFNRRTTLPTGWGAGIPKYAKNGEAAAVVLEYVSTPERALTLATNLTMSIDPWRTSTFDLENWLSVWPEYESYTRDYVKVMKETVALGLPDLQISGCEEYLKRADAEIASALVGTKSPEKALEDIVKAWNEITDRFGREKQKKDWNTQYDAMKASGIRYIPYKG